jgi:hypothetical protein
MVRSAQLAGFMPLRTLRWLSVRGAMVVLLGACCLLALTSDRFSDHPLILLTVPLVLAAVFLGPAGTAGTVVSASAVAVVW